MPNITPYNFYILYFCIIILVIFIIVFLSKTLKCLKAVNEYKPVLQNITNNLNETTNKTNGLKKKSENSKPVINKLFTFVPLLYAITKTYQNQDEKGVKGYRKATINTISKKQAKSMFQSYIKGLF